jgi:hypothetical protein
MGVALELLALRTEAYYLISELDGADKDYASTLFSYADALSNTVERLVQIVGALKSKIEGKPFDGNAYQQVLIDYERSTAKYVAVGKELNAHWERRCGSGNW